MAGQVRPDEHGFMTEKENDIRQAELNLKEAQCKLRQARAALEVGTKRAKAEFEEEVNTLTGAVREAQIEVEREEAWFSKAKDDVEKPFTNSQEN